jgi:putative hydrolase of the HAD superfamily
MSCRPTAPGGNLRLTLWTLIFTRVAWKGLAVVNNIVERRIRVLRAILFDLDATLLDRETSLHYFVEQQHQRLSQFLAHISRAEYTTRFIELDANGYVWKDRVYEQLITEFKISGITWADLLKDYVSNFHRYCIGFPGLEGMLQTVSQQGYLLGIITNGPDPFQMQNIETLGIRPYFAIILVSGAEGIKKPNPEIFRRALDRLGVIAEEAVFVGDHPKIDIEAAQRVGMKVIWKQSDYWGSCPSADAVCRELVELPGIIEQLL